MSLVTKKQSTKRIYLSTHRRSILKPHLSHEKMTIHIENRNGKKRETFGKLTLLKEVTLNFGAQHLEKIPCNMIYLTIPIIGKVTVICDLPGTIDVGEVQTNFVGKGKQVVFENHYKKEIIHFLLIGLQHDQPERNEIHNLELEQLTNLFTDININPSEENNQILLHLGKFSGRHDQSFNTCQTNAFVYVLQGAFEVQNCLLEKADGLGLSNIETIEFEALSNEAILLILEF